MWSISFCIWCCCLLALINGQLKPIMKSDNVYRNAFKIISMYNNVFQYNNFILYGSFRTKEGQSVGSSFAYLLMKEFEKPVINAGPQTDSLHNLISTRNFAVVFFSGNYDPMLDIVQNTMSRLAFLPILFVYKSKNNFPMNIAATKAFFKCFRKYLLQIYGNWTLILFLVFYFTSNAVIKKLNHRRMPLDEIFFRSLEITLSQPICNQIIRCMKMAEKIMMICSMTYNFLIMALFAGALTTHITTGFHMPDIVNVDSFLLNDLRIMVPISEEISIIKLDTVPKEIVTKMIFVDEKIFQQHLNSLNDNFVYIIAAHKWVQYEFIQKRLRQPKLKIASEPLCGVVRFLKLPVRPELPLTFKLNNFLDYALESGLKKKWMQMGLEQMKKAKLIKQHPYDPPTFLPLTLEFFMSVFIFLLSSLSLGLIVFLFECILMRWRQHRNAYNNVIVV
ncbi:hypothetical protein KR215_009018 [Drosophila sulfurigaster]|nr:hypothetical protein KR215_009018 [Drosophila sulfurigaster]